MSMSIGTTVAITGTIYRINKDGSYRVQVVGTGQPYIDFPADAVTPVVTTPAPSVDISTIETAITQAERSTSVAEQVLSSLNAVMPTLDASPSPL